MAIITGANCRLYIRGLSGTAEDSNLEIMVDRVDAMIARWLGWPLNAAGKYTVASGSYVLYLTGNGTKSLHLPIFPVSSVASIYDDPDLAYDDSADLVAASDYTLYGNE